MELFVTTTIALLLSTGAPITDPLLIEALEPSRARCEAEGGSELRYDPGLVTWLDVTGNGKDELRLVSEETAHCGPGPGLLYPPGTVAPLHVIAGGRVTSTPGGGWALMDVAFAGREAADAPGRLLVIRVGGHHCVAPVAAPCVVAFGWDGARAVSILDALGR